MKRAVRICGLGVKVWLPETNITGTSRRPAMRSIAADAISLPKLDIRDNEVGRGRIGLAYRVRFGIDDRADMMAHVLDE